MTGPPALLMAAPNSMAWRAKTFTTPAPDERTAPSSTKSAVAVLANGHLLLPYYIAPGNGALAAVSADNGLHWKTYRVPDTRGFVGDEWIDSPAGMEGRSTYPGV